AGRWSSGRRRRRSAPASSRSHASPWPRSFGLPELRSDELADGANRFLGSGAIGGYFDDGPFRAAKQEHAHDALGIGLLPVTPHGDVALVARGELDQFGRRPRMEAEVVDDLEPAHCGAHAPSPPGFDAAPSSMSRPCPGVFRSRSRWATAIGSPVEA